VLDDFGELHRHSVHALMRRYRYAIGNSESLVARIDKWSDHAGRTL
jgi:hypothetical protein